MGPSPGNWLAAHRAVLTLGRTAICIFVKPVLSGHLKLDKTKALVENGSIMKVESIAECSPWSILQYFWPALSDNLYWKPIFGVLFEWPLKTGFTVYDLHMKLRLAMHYCKHGISPLSNAWYMYAAQKTTFSCTIIFHQLLAFSKDQLYCRHPDKECINENYFFLIYQPKHMLWVLKRTISMRRFFWAPKTHV